MDTHERGSPERDPTPHHPKHIPTSSALAATSCALAATSWARSCSHRPAWFHIVGVGRGGLTADLMLLLRDKLTLVCARCGASSEPINESIDLPGPGCACTCVVWCTRVVRSIGLRLRASWFGTPKESEASTSIQRARRLNRRAYVSALGVLEGAAGTFCLTN